MDPKQQQQQNSPKALLIHFHHWSWIRHTLKWDIKSYNSRKDQTFWMQAKNKQKTGTFFSNDIKGESRLTTNKIIIIHYVDINSSSSSKRMIMIKTKQTKIFKFPIYPDDYNQKTKKTWHFKKSFNLSKVFWLLLLLLLLGYVCEVKKFPFYLWI